MGAARMARGIVDLLSEVEPNELTAVLDGRWGGLLRELRAQMAGVEVRDGSGLSTGEYRRQAFDDLHLLAKASYSRLRFDREYGGMGDPAGSAARRSGRWPSRSGPYLGAPSLYGGEVAG